MGIAVQVKRILKGNFDQTRYTKYLESIQFSNRDELKKLQAEKLSDLLNHAVENIPYYKDLKGKFALTPETVFEDIRNFPVLDKDTLISREKELTADNIKITSSLYTGGTFSKKATLHMDDHMELCAPDEFFNKKVGMVPGKSRLIFKADKRRKETHQIGGMDYDFNNISKSYRISHLFLNNKKFKMIKEILIHKKPKIIWGNTHAIFITANYVKNNDIKIRPPELALCGGQMLVPLYKERIEEVFKTKVYDRYGSVECGNTANQCKQQDGYHYVPTTHFIEVLDDNLNEVAEGETGNIYITTLIKRAMPMIRYKQDDLVEFTEKLCACDCNFPILAKIQGRRKEGVLSPKGTYLSLMPSNLIMSDSGEIKDYQIIQTEEDSMLIRYVTSGSNIKESTLIKIKKDIFNSMDYEMIITFKQVNAILPLKNGKVLRIIPLELYNELGESI